MVPNIAVILTDSSRRIIWVNNDFTNITGYTLNEVVGQKPSLLQGPKSEMEAIRKIRKGLEAQVSLQAQITNYRKDGEEYLCRLVIHPIFNDENELTNFIAFEVDGNKVKEDEFLPIMQLDQKYRSSSLKEAEEIKLFEQIKEAMTSNQLFLDPHLTLRRVANLLNTNTKYLSQVVNHQAGCNFQHFVNKYRIEEAKSKITDKAFQNLTLYGIALQCGFKNKSTFYKVFKEVTRMTPKEYIKQHQQ